MIALFPAVVGFYIIAGCIFALVFAFHWVDEFDEQAKDAPISFRMILLPASVIFWPYLLYRIKTKKNSP